MRRPLVTILTVLALVLVGCTSTVAGHGSAAPSTRTSPTAPGTSSPTQPPATTSPGSGSGSGSSTQAPAQFVDCSKDLRLGQLNFPKGRLARLSFDCAAIHVPLDYSRPNGATVTLLMIKIHDSANTHSKGDLLVNPGGPGGSGTNFVISLATELPDAVLSHYDIVGFDPRGVGFSDPVKCISDHRKDVLNAQAPDVSTARGFQHARATAHGIAAGCEQKYGSALAQFDTVNTARDMDRIRASLGDPRMDYLGFSYGTRLGSIYAHLFPQRVGVMVLDGAEDPRGSIIRSNATQLKGFTGAFGQFAQWCRAHKPCSSLGSPAAAVSALQESAGKHPIPTSAKGDSRRATTGIVDTGVLSALYTRKEWPTLGKALIQARHGDSAVLFRLADSYNERQSNGHYTNSEDANLTISCNDEPANTPSDAAIKAAAARWARRYPLFGGTFAASLFSCQQWQPDRTPLPMPTARDSAHKILVVGNLHDPATPYQGAKDMTRILGNAELLTWNGEGHTSYLNGSSCVDDKVTAYLVHGTLPPQHTVCPR